MIASFNIGPVAVSPNLVLAPMSGVTNTCFRRLIRQENPEAVGLAVTEFISIEGLTRRNGRSLQMMEYAEEERPISIQIFGYDIDRMVEAAQMVEEAGADIVDINCGCPVPKVVKRGGGCELMRQTSHLQRMLSKVVQAVGIPVTLKIRSGWDEASKNAREVGLLAQDCGIAMLAVHGRTRRDLYRGRADWELIAELASELSIPIVGSGDIVDVDSAVKAFSSGAAGLMIGRGAMMNPWIFSEIAAARAGREYRSPDALATVDVLERYSALLLQAMPERAAVGKMKQFASQVTKRVPASTKARKLICSSKSLAEMQIVLQEWRAYLDESRLRKAAAALSRDDLRLPVHERA